MAISRTLPNSRNRFPPHLLAMAMLVVTALLRADDQFAAGDEISHGERLFAIDVQPLLRTSASPVMEPTPTTFKVAST